MWFQKSKKESFESEQFGQFRPFFTGKVECKYFDSNSFFLIYYVYIYIHIILYTL